ncbi:MAG: 1-phosphofructokinase [Spirochaetae bacterium HGW-Spirochaetae-7]|nr:MAG: 1-phosphofructokinase [Spirochaetae bacterium HGW-Spirochaetae-7]
MIRTLSLNPAVDRTATIARFAVDAVNRVSATRLDAGGKGINVSKAIGCMGGKSVAYGFLGGAAGRFIRSSLDGQGIRHDFVEVDGETRTNLKIVDPVLGTHTDVNESGPRATEEALADLEARLFGEAGTEDIFVFSGSVCPGVEPGVYASWIRRARSLGARTVLDADGEALALGVAAGPTIVKPNLDELERLVGSPLTKAGHTDQGAAIAAARGLLSSGARLAVVSLGPEGALFVDRDSAIMAHGIPVKALSTVGAGDSVVAALCLGLERGASLERLVTPAIAAGTAAAATAGSEAFDPSSLAAYEKLVTYEILQGRPE